jgi:cytochrome bd-type quinol oxidase subunit 1
MSQDQVNATSRLLSIAEIIVALVFSAWSIRIGVGRIVIPIALLLIIVVLISGRELPWKLLKATLVAVCIAIIIVASVLIQLASICGSLHGP